MADVFYIHGRRIDPTRSVEDQIPLHHVLPANIEEGDPRGFVEMYPDAPTNVEMMEYIRDANQLEYEHECVDTFISNWGEFLTEMKEASWPSQQQ